MNDLLRLRRVHHRVGPGRDKSVVGADLIQDFGMFVAAPLGLLNALFGHDGPCRPMEPRAIDQAGLKILQFITGNDMVVNVNNYGPILSL